MLAINMEMPECCNECGALLKIPSLSYCVCMLTGSRIKYGEEDLVDGLCPLDLMPEIVFCKDCTKHNKDYRDVSLKTDVCPLTLVRGKAQGHEFDYQFCAYGRPKTK